MYEFIKFWCFFYFKYSFTLSNKVQISEILKGSSGGSFIWTSSPYSIKVFKINSKKSIKIVNILFLNKIKWFYNLLFDLKNNNIHINNYFYKIYLIFLNFYPIYYLCL
jgi:hypothetical protein